MNFNLVSFIFIWIWLLFVIIIIIINLVTHWTQYNFLINIYLIALCFI